MPKEKAIHLGDGAYAIFDGFGVMLRANSHKREDCTGEVYLEPETLKALDLVLGQWYNLKPRERRDSE